MLEQNFYIRYIYHKILDKKCYIHRRGKGGEKRGRDVGVWTEREKNGREMDGGGVGWRRKEGEEGMKESYSTIVGGGQGKVELCV